MKATLSALFAAVLLGILSISTDASAQSRAYATANSTAVASVSIIDGIELGIRKSNQEGYDLQVEAGGLKASFYVREIMRPVSVAKRDEEPTASQTEIVAAFE